MSSDCSANKICRIILIIFIILIIIAGVGIGAFYLIQFLNKKNEKEEEEDGENISNEPFIIMEKHRQRISLLKECMNTYGIEEMLELIDGTPNSKKISNNKILSISTLEINRNKGETIEIFKNGLELQEGEYAYISYESSKKKNIVKIENGLFQIPYDLSEEVSETPFTFILYFNYDPSIN